MPLTTLTDLTLNPNLTGALSGASFLTLHAEPSSMEPKPSIPRTPSASFENFSESCPTGKPSWDPLYEAMALSFFVDSSNVPLTKSSSLPGKLILTPEIEKMSVTTKEGSEEWEKKKKSDEFIVSKTKSLAENEDNGLCGEFENGRRQSVSLGAAQVKVADIFAGNGVKIVAVDMPTSMQIHAVNCARRTRNGMEKFTSKALASALKKEFDGVYGPAWHCIVGSSFGSFVTHSVGGFLYFSMDQKLYILLFKTAVQRAD